MVEKVIMQTRNVVEFARYRVDRGSGRKMPEMSRVCRHCGAGLADGEREEECSSAFNAEIPARRFYVD